MGLPDIQKQIVKNDLDKFYEERVPKEVRDQVRFSYEFRGNAVTLFEDRPNWIDASAKWSHMKVAQFRFDPDKLTWTLFCRDRNEKWHKYIGVRPTKSFSKLVEEVDEDPTGIFWG